MKSNTLTGTRDMKLTSIISVLTLGNKINPSFRVQQTKIIGFVLNLVQVMPSVRSESKLKANTLIRWAVHLTSICLSSKGDPSFKTPREA